MRARPLAGTARPMIVFSVLPGARRCRPNGRLQIFSVAEASRRENRKLRDAGRSLAGGVVRLYGAEAARRYQ